MIIGLIGFKQVGKSTAANYLEEKYGFVRHNMKDALVAEVKQNFPDLLAEIVRQLELRRSEFEIVPWTVDRLFVDKPPLMRALLQNYGTEVRRRDNDNYWVNRWDTIARNTGLFRSNLVTDDVRFKNEAQAVIDRGGILIRLTRPDITTGGSHRSEIEQLEIIADYTIECEPGGQESLYAQLDEIINKQ